MVEDPVIGSTGCVRDDFFKSWGELFQFLGTNPATGWIYRGLPRYEYHPISSLERVLSDAKIPVSEWKTAEQMSIQYFKKRARRVLPTTPQDEDILGWLSLMQHYGAPTRLIDWTESPFVACFFAYAGASPGSDAALWFLQSDFCRSHFGIRLHPADPLGTTSCEEYQDGKLVRTTYPSAPTLDTLAREESDLIRHVINTEAKWPLPLPIICPDERMSAQRGCFVCLGMLGSDPPILSYLLEPGKYPDSEGKIPRPTAFYIAKGQTEVGPGHPPAFETPRPPSDYILKIRLRHEWKTEVMNTLTRQNISADTLFPGLDGVGRGTELYLRHRIQTGASYSFFETDY